MTTLTTVREGVVGGLLSSLGWGNDSNSGVQRHIRHPSAVSAQVTSCQAVVAAEAIEPRFPCYELSRQSGVLAFWDELGEDIYSFQDGEEV